MSILEPRPELKYAKGSALHDSALVPLQNPVFRALWIANTASNIGTWIQDVGGTWLMTSLTHSPVYVALMQAATSLPLFLLALPGGVASDLFDRRKLLIFTTLWIAASASFLGVLILFGLHSPNILLSLTFILNLGSALFVPAWQSSIPEMVQKEHLTGAMELNSASFNVARAVGPAIGGFLLVAVGPWVNFFVNALSCIVLVVLLLKWKHIRPDPKLPPEQFIAAMRIGIRYATHSPRVITILIRTAAFIVPASALFALLPILVKTELGLGANAFGSLLACIGVGALTGVYLSPRFRAKFTANQLSRESSILIGLSILGLAMSRSLLVLSGLMFLAGLGWLLTLSAFQISIVGAVPSWVRGRAVAIYLLVFFGGISAGATLWGVLADHFGIFTALLLAGGSLLAGVLFTLRFKIQDTENLELTPSGRWVEPVAVREIDPHEQPVIVTVEYRIDPSKQVEFKNAMKNLKQIRQRDGAFSWELAEDAADLNRYIEIFYLESWTEHLHQHRRGTKLDQWVEDKVKALHIGDQPPKVTHLVISKS